MQRQFVALRSRPIAFNVHAVPAGQYNGVLAGFGAAAMQGTPRGGHRPLGADIGNACSKVVTCHRRASAPARSARRAAMARTRVRKGSMSAWYAKRAASDARVWAYVSRSQTQDLHRVWREITVSARKVQTQAWWTPTSRVARTVPGRLDMSGQVACVACGAASARASQDVLQHEGSVYPRPVRRRSVTAYASRCAMCDAGSYSTGSDMASCTASYWQVSA